MKKYNTIFSSKVAPNPLEVRYWADLTASPAGKIIKVYNGKTWEPIIGVSYDGDNLSYELLTNKPMINGVELDGNVTLEELGILSADVTTEELPSEIITEEELAEALSDVEGSNIWNDV